MAIFGDFELFIKFMQNLLNKLQILILFELILVCVLSFSAYFSVFTFSVFPTFLSNSSRVIKNPKSKFDGLLCQLSLKRFFTFVKKI